MGPGQPEAPPASPPPPPAPRAAAGDDVVVPLRPSRSEPVPQATAPEPSPARPQASGDWWAQLLERMQLDGLIANLARHAMLTSREENEWHLLLDPGHQPMATDARVRELGEAISAYMGKPVRLRVSFESGGEDSPAQRDERARKAQLARAREALRTDPVINALVTEFDGRLDEDSIEPE